MSIKLVLVIFCALLNLLSIFIIFLEISRWNGANYIKKYQGVVTQILEKPENIQERPSGDRLVVSYTDEQQKALTYELGTFNSAGPNEYANKKVGDQVEFSKTVEATVEGATKDFRWGLSNALIIFSVFFIAVGVLLKL